MRTYLSNRLAICPKRRQLGCRATAQSHCRLCKPHRRASFDHLLGAGEQRGWPTRQHFSPTQDVTQPLLRLVLRSGPTTCTQIGNTVTCYLSLYGDHRELGGAIMQLTLTVAVLCCTTLGAVHAQEIVPPEIVRLESIRVDNDMKIVTVGNAKGHYKLICNVNADGCITPQRNKNYLLFDKDTRWKMPGAKE